MKKLICGCCIALLLIMALPVRAAEPLSVHAEGYTAGQGALRLYWNTNLQRTPAASEVTLQVGSQTLNISGIQTFKQTGEGATYLFLVDISGSIGAKKLDAIKKTLLMTVEAISDKDNAGVLLVGDEVEIQPFTADKAALSTQIESILGGTKTTNLYTGIVKGLDLLATDAESNLKKCLIVLSDGEDYSVTGVTREEVERKISALHIPVYTVAMAGEKPKAKYVESAKLLGSFARLSPGGKALMHDLKEETSKAAAREIVDSVLGSLVLTADITGLAFAGNEQYMRLELNAEAAGKASDGYNIATGPLAAAQATPEPPSTPAPTPVSTPIATDAPTEPAPAPAPEAAPEPEIALWVYIGIGGLALLALAVVLILVISRRRKKRNALAALQEPLSDTLSFSEMDMNVTASIGGGDTVPMRQSAGAITLRFTKMGPSGGQVYHAKLLDSITIGRKRESNTLAFPEDDMLSGKHCEIIRRDANLLIGDLGSTNKTYVNGVVTTGYHKLEPDDVIYIGSMELRVNWDIE